MSVTTSALDLPNWLAQQRAKNAADGNLLTPPPAANRPAWWDNPVGAERLNDTYAGMPSSDVSPVIGAYGAHPITAAMRGNALDIASTASQFGPADMASIRAFHGSPYDFNAFDTSKIGTGEGAQAYGHGLYFAENEGVARNYQQQLTPPTPISPDFKAALKAEDYLGFDTPSQAIAAIRAHPDWVQRWDVENPAALKSAFDAHEAVREANRGRVYEVSLNADPEHFLDWDKPLSEQHDKVVSAVADLAAKKGIPMGNATGARAYEDLSNPPYGTRGHGVNDPAALSEALRDAGIPGIKYLDQGSRSQGQGTSNFVIFDPKTIEILRKYGIAGLIGAGAASAPYASGAPDQQTGDDR